MKIDDIANLPNKPGVYLYKDKDERIIYIGKAKALKKRVSSYFVRKHADIKTSVLVDKITSLDYIVTDSEADALILEATLIKKHKPKFNIDLKDNKTYPFIKVTLNEDFPRVIKTRHYSPDGKYFGPYTNVSVIYQSLDIIERLFKIRTCKLKLTENSKLKPCLNYQIGRCSAPCFGAISPSEYNLVINDVMIFLTGKLDKLTDALKNKMDTASKLMEYEKAAIYRDQLNFIKNINEKQKVYTPDKMDRDVFGFYTAVNKNYFTVLYFREGKLIGKRAYINEDNDDNDKALVDLIAMHYEDNELPDEILIPFIISDLTLIEEILKSKGQTKVIFPQKGLKRNLVEMSSTNAKYEFLKDKRLNEREGALVELGKLIGMNKLPRRIECFDISNTEGILAVGSMVSFLNGKPDKKNYRIFRIKTVKGINDVAMIEESVSRRYTRVLNENLALPDLLLIDGGKAQVNAAKRVLDALALNDVSVIGLAKRDEQIVFPDSRGNIVLEKTNESLRLIQAIRDEAHRFGINFHKRLRSKKMKFSFLSEIKGIGAKKVFKIMKYFKTLDKLSEASIEDIIKAEIDKQTALAVYDYFHKN